MDQKRIGSFLKELRKEKNITQEQLAEQLNVSARTVSRWETGNNMPDIGVLVEMADFYDVDIKEIIDGEKKNENMEEKVKETLVKVAEYSKADKQYQLTKMCKWVGVAIAAGGLFVIMSALLIFPSDSSWGSIYSIIGSMILAVGLSQVLSKHRMIGGVGTFIVMVVFLLILDGISVKTMNQIPRFSYSKLYSGDTLTCKYLFGTYVKDLHIQIDRGYDENFTREEVDDAIDAIKCKFSEWEGFEMYSIKYVSGGKVDKTPNDFGEVNPYDEYMEFISDFRSSNTSSAYSQGFNKDYEYQNWQWSVARKAGGKWEVVSWGY